MLEEWKPVEGFEDRYKVSSKGRVYSIVRKSYCKPKIDKDGYHEYVLWDGKKSTYRRGHRLVALHFIPNPDNLPLVNHIDHTKDNNDYRNLEWCTVAYNTHYSARKALLDKGKKNISCLTTEDCKEIIRLYLEEDYTYKQIVEKFNMTCEGSEIADMISGRRYSSVSGVTEDLRKAKNIRKTKNGV
jgi:predicted DNA-binding protein YlxM (UPF0122 family)